ncbi:hypothetical protein GON03_03315 [Nocardioides sp. MAH-18]|uniref:Uncharacterized protein n=1 Tax=Nocardioides agri TaxID=2682843 RepID=A0A6L6XN73_9ACTN|nr:MULTISPECIES: hypothetical protein [unclassified Nocardioides]MBA2953329.1 hypothetical protein [Nocardioides sp. CGMCC 1.13656]MVQ48197.1 hypothetical protein [Nocardioides sp. MAH-18]
MPGWIETPAETTDHPPGYISGCRGTTRPDPYAATTTWARSPSPSQLVGLLGWIEPVFIPLVLLAPVVTGALCVAVRIEYRWIAVVWCSAGINLQWTD